MHVAARRPIKPGIALAGAAVIAVSPLAPTLPGAHMPDIHLPPLHSAQVELTALTNPLELWAKVLGTALDNAGQLGGEVFNGQAPIIDQIMKDQLADMAVLGNAAQSTMDAVNTAVSGLPDTLQSAANQLAAGDITGAVDMIVSAALPLALSLVDGFNAGFPVVANTVQNLANVVAATPSLLLPTLLAVTGPVISMVNAGAASTEAVVTALGAGDFEGLANAMIDAPATLTGAVLNGFGNSPLGLPSPGLLSPTGAFGAFSAGTIAGLLDLRDIVTKALHPLATPGETLQPKQLSGTPAGELTGTSGAKSVAVDIPMSSTDSPSATPSTASGAVKDTPAGESTSEADATTPSSDSAQASTPNTDDSASDAVDTGKDAPAESPKGDDADTTTDKAGENGSDTATSSGKPTRSHEQFSGRHRLHRQVTKHSAPKKDAAESHSAASSTSKSDSK